MDFDLNDPLGDILSDDSDDSFFNDDKKKPKAKTHQLINIETKKSNVFGLSKVDEVSNVNSASDWLGLLESKTNNTLPEATKDSNAISNIVDASSATSKAIDSVPKLGKQPTAKRDDIDFSFLGTKTDNIIKSHKPPDENNQSTWSLDNLLDDKNDLQAITHDSRPKSTHKTDLPRPSTSYTPTASMAEKRDHSKSLKFDSKIDSTFKKSNEDINKGDSKREFSFGKQKRQKSKDWLGLLTDETDDFGIENQETQTKISELFKKDKIEDLNASKSKVEIEHDSRIDKSFVQSQKDENIDDQRKENFSALIDDVKPSLNLENRIIKNNIDIQQQSAELYLQQQESHLLVAMQLKAQEDRFANLQQRQEDTHRIQQEITLGHRQQLKEMMQNQANHRDHLQKVIMQHQHRINNYIQTWLKPDNKTSSNESKSIEDNIQLQADEKYSSAPFEIQKMINMITENHEREISLIETSYKKQLSLADESIIMMEGRFKFEFEKISEYYALKIHKMEQDSSKMTELYENIIKTNYIKHENEKSQMEQKHMENINVLQKQHKQIIENIHDSIAQEQNTIKETSDYSSKLNSIISNVEKNNEMCFKMVEKLESVRNFTNENHTKALQAQEEQLQKLIEHLEKQKAYQEKEMCDRKIILNSIEERVKQQEKFINEERANLKEEQTKLLQAYEEKKLDHERLLTQFDVEKEKFQKRVLHFENTNEKLKLDMEEKLKTIERDTIHLENEKEVFNETKRKYQEKRLQLDEDVKEIKCKYDDMKYRENKIQENELKLIERSRELEILTRTALAKQKVASDKIMESKHNLQVYQEKFNKLQEQTLSLNARERQIAKEKTALSRERLLLYNQRSENEYAVCNLCKATSTEKIMNLKSDVNLREYNNKGFDMSDLYAENFETFSGFNLLNAPQKNDGHNQNVTILNNLNDCLLGGNTLDGIRNVHNLENYESDNLANLFCEN